MSKQNKSADMPILDLNLGNTSRFEASRFLDTPETISAFLAEAMKEHDPEVMMQAIAEVAKAQGVNRLAQNAGVNRESLYKALKGGTHVRYDTVMRLMLAVGVELTVKPAAKAPAKPAAKPAARPAAKTPAKPSDTRASA